jgi:hypothetical protein
MQGQPTGPLPTIKRRRRPRCYERRLPSEGRGRGAESGGRLVKAEAVALRVEAAQQRPSEGGGHSTVSRGRPVKAEAATSWAMVEADLTPIKGIMGDG